MLKLAQKSGAMTAGNEREVGKSGIKENICIGARILRDWGGDRAKIDKKNSRCEEFDCKVTLELKSQFGGGYAFERHL